MEWFLNQEETRKCNISLKADWFKMSTDSPPADPSENKIVGFLDLLVLPYLVAYAQHLKNYLRTPQPWGFVPSIYIQFRNLWKTGNITELLGSVSRRIRLFALHIYRLILKIKARSAASVDARILGIWEAFLRQAVQDPGHEGHQTLVAHWPPLGAQALWCQVLRYDTMLFTTWGFHRSPPRTAPGAAAGHRTLVILKTSLAWWSTSGLKNMGWVSHTPNPSPPL